MTAALDPAEAIRALSAELHDALRQLLDTTDREDPTLLDKIRAVSNGLGRRITNARKRVAAEQAPEKPAERGQRPTSPPPTQKTPPGPPPAPKPAVTTPASKPVTPAAATPKPTATPANRPARTPAATKPTARPPATSRRLDSRPRWLLPVLLIASVLSFAAVLLGIGIGWALAGTALTAAALFTHQQAGRRHERARRQGSPTGPARRGTPDQ